MMAVRLAAIGRQGEFGYDSDGCDLRSDACYSSRAGEFPNAIEGKFGQCKCRLGMSRVVAKWLDCSDPGDAGVGMAFIAAAFNSDSLGGNTAKYV